MDVHNPSLRRELGPVDAIALLIGCVLGSGVFVVPGQIAATLPSATFALGLWIFGALLTVGGAWCVAELSARSPDAGGPYTHLTRAYGERVGFLYGWMTLVVVNCAVPAALALAFAASMQAFWPGAPEHPSAVAALLIAAMLALSGLRMGKRVQALLSAGKLLAVLFIVAVVAFNEPSPVARIGAWRGGGELAFGAIGGALVGILWTYDGWTYLAFSAEEARRPARTLRLGFGVGSLVVTLAVLAANCAYYAALPAAEMEATASVASSSVARYVGSLGARAIDAAILVAVFGSLTALFATGTRCAVAMARNGHLPRSLAAVSARTGAPVVAIVVQALGASLLMFQGGFIQILSVSFVADWLFKLLLIGSLCRSSRELPAAPALSRTRWLAAGWCVVVAVIVAVAAVAEPRAALLGVALTALGLPIHWLVMRRQRMQASSRAQDAVQVLKQPL